ncbi:hypothetical protein V7O62_02215 [Methanolobus sp. ZRKC2]|uniref:hypothetical protein n=1 Tax=Methanolobus sp. ZRKC2 TaxID=3125783 RepID=UPI0032567172
MEENEICTIVILPEVKEAIRILEPGIDPEAMYDFIGLPSNLSKICEQIGSNDYDEWRDCVEFIYHHDITFLEK